MVSLHTMCDVLVCVMILRVVLFMCICCFVMYYAVAVVYDSIVIYIGNMSIYIVGDIFILIHVCVVGVENVGCGVNNCVGVIVVVTYVAALHSVVLLYCCYWCRCYYGS